MPGFQFISSNFPFTPLEHVDVHVHRDTETWSEGRGIEMYVSR
jgi:hypothetical protein